MKILVTAFDPFGGEEMNPALEAVKRLPEKIDQHRIVKLEVPTVFHKSKKMIMNKLNSDRFDAAIAVGQAGGRSEISLERVGINIDDARIPDNEGNQPIDEVIQNDGAPAYFSTLPVKRMTYAIKNKGIPARLSNSAGTFVCNHVLYQLGYISDKYFKNLKFTFIHVPFTPEQLVNKVEMPSMSIETITNALIYAISSINEKENDIRKVLSEIY